MQRCSWSDEAWYITGVMVTVDAGVGLASLER